MFDMFENFFSSMPYTIAAVAAVGTWGAIVVALWLAHASSKPKVKVFISHSFFLGDGHPKRHVIQAFIANRGRVSIYISNSPFSFSLSNRWIAPYLLIAKVRYTSSAQFEGAKLDAGMGLRLILGEGIDWVRGHFDVLYSKSKLPPFLVRARWIRCIIRPRFIVHLDDGRSFSFHFSKDFEQKFLHNLPSKTRSVGG